MTTAQTVNTYDYAIEGPRNSRLWSQYYLLYLQDITAVFDGFAALDVSDLGILHNELRVVVGPNGAGKSTMCDVISGLTQPATGMVYFDGKNITGEDVSAISSAGVGRKFQVPNVFDSLSVWDNMRLAIPSSRKSTRDVAQRLEDITPRLAGPAGIACYKAFKAMRNVGGRMTPELKDRIEQLLSRVNLLDHRNELARNLSHGQRQWLAISALILARPKLLLVDEPAAGLTDHETELTAELLTELRGEHTLIVIEHDMDFVRALNARVTVLDSGKILADGSLDEVQANEQVIEAYLGR